jgi:anti-anti-sigma regulatory factor
MGIRKTRGGSTFGRNFANETIEELPQDLAQRANRLIKDSKILLDFTGVTFFSPASIRALTQFHEKLRTKGSRMALCCLDPAARDCFFPPR